MEVFDIGINDLEPVSLKIDEPTTSSKPSVNFGPGIELLMNDKKRSSSNAVNIDLGELDNLEKELNDLSNKADSQTKTVGGLSGFTSNLFNFGNTSSSSQPAEVPVDNFEEYNSSNLGSATKETIGSTKTWDGYSKFNEIPSNASASSASANMSEREKRRKKRLMIKKLEEWNEKGLTKNISHFTIDSPYEEVEDEYETALEDKRKKDSVKLQGWWFMTFVNSIEYANSAFNPFDINLDGWGEQVSEDIDSYEDIFSELYEKYKGGKMAPELSLLLRLGFSAAVVNFTNKALSSATPGFNDVIKQSPELMKMFTNATVSSMSQQSPGFAFASNLMNAPDKINTSFGPPPPPVETKNMAPPPRPAGSSMQYTQMPSNRQDISAARGTMFRESGVDVNQPFADATKQERSMRPEMRGPQNTDIDNILSGLKTRTVNIQEPPMPSMQQPQQPNMNSFMPNINQPAANVTIETLEDDSMISISSLRDLNNTNMPKRSNRRKNRSDKNTISLDI